MDRHYITPSSSESSLSQYLFSSQWMDPCPPPGLKRNKQPPCPLDFSGIPSTPLRDRCGSAISPAQLITPQSYEAPSLSRSFSTPSVSQFDDPDSPLDTPLATPTHLDYSALGKPFENFDFFQFDNLPVGKVRRVSQPSNASAPNVSSAASGVNPFYTPSHAVRKLSTDVENLDENSANSSYVSPEITLSDSLESIPTGEVISDDPLMGMNTSNKKDSTVAPQLFTKQTNTSMHTQMNIDESGVISGPRSMHTQIPRSATMPLHSQGRSRFDPKFQSTSSLDLNGERPFACESCSRGFRRAEHLKRHMKTHTNERPFQCPVSSCSRAFARNDNLKAHIKTHAKKEGKNSYVHGILEKLSVTSSRTSSNPVL